MRHAVTMLMLVSPFGLGAQHNQHASLDSLARETARLTARYADRRVAAADGYRRLGPDFPGMGEHWLHPGALLSGAIDAARPTLLMYATIAGRPTLLGVGFVTTTRADEPAVNVPGWPDAWHEHSGLLADESGVAPGASAASDTHVWILHAWTSMPNPGGVYTPDNWALPFARAELTPESAPDADAGRALALAFTGDAYLRDVLADANVRTPANAVRVDAVIATSRERVAAVVSRARLSRSLTAGDVKAVAGEWQHLGTALRAVIGPDVDRYLTPPHSAVMGGHHHE